MEYVQERITTLHDLTGHVPPAPTDDVAVVVPMTEREFATHATEQMLDAMEAIAPGRVVVALRAPSSHVEPFVEWLEGFDLPLSVLWCSSESVQDLLRDHGLDGDMGKGRDVWLALGVAASTHTYVICHDADTKSYAPTNLAALAAPLDRGFQFTKAYYARVENNRLYGRLFRLFYAPLVRALDDRHRAPIIEYLAAFRYALAGEFGTTAALARKLRVEPRYGLEVGTLGDVFDVAGFEGTAQVDLGTYEHDHRAVGGPTGLSDMSRDVGEALLRAVETHGVTPDYETLPAAYRDAASVLINEYAADAAHNGLDYEGDAERTQVDSYAGAVVPPGPDRRLPAWETAPIDPKDVVAVSEAALDEGRKG